MDPSVNILKMILESDDGKKWFTEYLNANLRLHLSLGTDYLDLSISFDGNLVIQRCCKVKIQIGS